MHDVTLIGGFHCTLTTEERNAWAEFVNAHQAMRGLLEVGSSINAIEAGMPAGQEKVSQLFTLNERHDQLTAELFQVGKQWHAEHIAPKTHAQRLQESASYQLMRITGRQHLIDSLNLHHADGSSVSVDDLDAAADQ